MLFVPGFKPTKVDGESIRLLFQNQEMLVKEDGKDFAIPPSAELEVLGLVPEDEEYIGSLDGRYCLAGELPPSASLPEGFTLKRLRSLFGKLGPEWIAVGGLANQLLQWRCNHRYCGRCGRPMESKTDERARFCPECGLINYPRLSPAIIVAVIRDDRILLAHSQRFPSKFYSVLAGFVEPGETLEGCIEREVQEEVGIAVKNIRYFGSQPWPFPDSLMIGFTAEYAAGEIEIDDKEILDAGWFPADGLPPIPPKLSIARRLIDWFVESRTL